MKYATDRFLQRRTRPWALAPAQYSHIRLADGRFVPVLAGGMVETAINALGGVLRDVDPVSRPQ